MSDEQTLQPEQQPITMEETKIAVENETTEIVKPAKQSKFFVVVFEDKGDTEGNQCESVKEFFNWAEFDWLAGQTGNPTGVKLHSLSEIAEYEAFKLTTLNESTLTGEELAEQSEQNTQESSQEDLGDLTD